MLLVPGRIPSDDETLKQYFNVGVTLWRHSACWEDAILFFIAPSSIDQSHKSHNASEKYTTMHHFVTEMCTYVHISVTKWCIVGCDTGALWNLCNRYIIISMA